ncbi:MAG: hypothetical protein Kow00124_17750 [Anaerolineae bacterium]
MREASRSGFGTYPLEIAALGLLMPGGKHGYSLYQDFEVIFGSIWKAGQAKFYMVLTDLEKQGCLDSTTEPQEGRPARKVYHITEAGREQFLQWLHRPIRSMRAARVELVARLRFFNYLRLPGAAALIDAQKEVFQAMLDEWEAAPRDPLDPFYVVIDEFRRRQALFLIEWLDVCKGLIDQGLFIP